jgi:hypothetical protein
MAIRLFAGRQYVALCLAQVAMHNHLGRFTLRIIQGGRRSALIFYRPLLRRNAWDSGIPGVSIIEK